MSGDLTRVKDDSLLPETPTYLVHGEVARLARAYPRQDVTPATFTLYIEDLAGIRTGLLHEAVSVLIRRSQWFPTIAEIRRECAEQMLALPTEGQAVEAVEQRAVWARERAAGGAESAPDAHPLVLRALSQAGGLRALRASSAPGAWHAQFLRAYRELRAAEIERAQVGARTPAIPAGVSCYLVATVTRSDLTAVRLKAKSGAWFVNPELRARMIEDARNQGTNLTDLATKILSKRYGVDYTPSARRSSPAVGPEDQMNFRFSDELKRAIIVGAAPMSITQAIRVALCAHYDLPMP